MRSREEQRPAEEGDEESDRTRGREGRDGDARGPTDGVGAERRLGRRAESDDGGDARGERRREDERRREEREGAADAGYGRRPWQVAKACIA